MIQLEGTYQGKNLYVQNPFSPNGVGFCVTEVLVNDQITTDETGSSAFEIDLRNFNLKTGDPVMVKIFHKDGCKPKVLNPEVLKPKSTFEVTIMEVNKTDAGAALHWVTVGEKGKLDFVIEQFRWNKWVKVGETGGIGTTGPNSYNIKVPPNSGQNTFRVKQLDYTGQARISKTVIYTSDVKPISFSPVKVKEGITLTGETLYEVYDQYGSIVKKGEGVFVDAQSLKKGGYFLNYDNTTGEFFKL